MAQENKISKLLKIWLKPNSKLISFIPKLKHFIQREYFPNNQKSVWSIQKRLLTTLLITSLILFTSIITGGSIYLIGRITGVFHTQDLTKLVIKGLNENQSELQTLLAEEQSTPACINHILGFSVKYHSSIQPLFQHGSDACRQLKIPFKGSNYNGSIVIDIHQGSKETTLQQFLTNAKNVYVDTYNHPQYEASFIKGEKNQQNFIATIMAISPSESISIEFLPAEIIQEKEYWYIVNHFRTL